MLLGQPTWDFKFQTFLQCYISIFIISKNSEQSHQWSVRYSPDKSSVFFGTPVGQPYSLTFLVLKRSCISPHPFLPYPQISEQSVQWLLRTVLGGKKKKPKKRKKNNYKKKRSKNNKSPHFIRETL